jgi:hypothetical protein
MMLQETKESLMKKMCVIAAVFVLLPLALWAQEFNPAKGPLEGVWENETDEEDVLVFTGNLMLEKNRDSTYSIYPGMVYRNGEAYGLMDPDYDEYMFTYRLSGNTLEITEQYEKFRSFKRSGDAILQNKSPLEGIWTGSFRNPDNPDEILAFTYIFTGQLMIASAKGDASEAYVAAKFSYSDSDNTLTSMGDSVSCKVSGDTMTMRDKEITLVLTRKR